MMFPMSGGMASGLAGAANPASGFSFGLGQAAMGLGIAGGLFDIASGISNQRKQAKYAERMWEETAQASFKDASFQFSQLNKQEQQRVQQGAQILQNLLRQSAQARGATVAQAGAGGVSGASVQALESDLARQKMSQIIAQQQNLQSARDQMDAQRQQVAAQATNRIRSAMSSYQPQQPDIFGQLFQLGASTIGTYAQVTTPTVDGREFI